MRKNEIKDNKEMVLFENNKIRRQMYNGEWNYAIADIIEILTDSKDPNAYWRKLKERLNKEGNESVTNCHGLKMIAKDGKLRTTDYAILTDEISKGTFGITTQQHKDIKSLDRQNLRDNMSAMELALMTLAEVTTTEIHKTNNSQGVVELQSDAKKGGGIAGVTRKNIEKQLGKPVVTSKNANDFRKNKRLNNNNNKLV
ncbi:MAG: hypothetical protein IJH76_04855 [Clostridia bacterium]|nr:hypothetical protein [Clostridia bacterium]